MAERAWEEIEALDKPHRERIKKFLARVDGCSDPKKVGDGAALQGNLAGFWRWRVGHYRIRATFEYPTRTVFVVRVLHRSEAYEFD